MKKVFWHVSGLVAVTLLTICVVMVPRTKAVSCAGIFSGNTDVVGCDAVPALNSFATTDANWGVYQRPSTPSTDDLFDNSVADGLDPLGIVQSTKLDPFFGIQYLDNPENPSGQARLVIGFDISGIGSLASISIDLGAMGDFELSDTYTFSYTVDGGAEAVIFDINANEGGNHTYTMENGSTNTFSDPMVVTFPSGGSCATSSMLDNVLQTCSATLSGTGNVLTLTLDAQGYDPDEVLAFDNIVIRDVADGSVNAVVMKAMRAKGAVLPLLAILAAATAVAGVSLIEARRRKEVN